MRSVSLRTVLASLAASALTTAAWSQCDVTPPSGTLTLDNNQCGATPDANGGCNASPAVFSDLGSIGSGATMTVAGKMGLYIPSGATTYTSRDLDWYLVSAPAGTLQVSLTTQNSGATGQLPNSIIFIKKNVGADPCLGNFDVGFQSTACPHVQSITAAAGTHLIVVTVPFDTTAGTTTAQACGNYLMTLSHTPLQFAVCGTSTESCTAAHSTGGCNLPDCCDQVCSFNPLCCDIAWDQGCVDTAVDQCGLFIYSCAPPAGAPANDCAISSQLITVGQQNVIANNQNAGTDGPGPVASACAAAMGKDLWYTIKAPGNGALTLTTCPTGDATTDTVIEVYGLGLDPVMTASRAQSLPDLFIGCVDDTCGIVGGPSAFTLIDAVQDEFYLVRIGGWYDETAGGANTADVFAVTVETSFEYVVFTTGSQHYIVASGANTNLGLSSGCVSATLTQRWLAQPFSVPSTSASWDVKRITAKGFVPAGTTNANLNYTVWRRNSGNPAPVAADQLVAGSVAFPVPYDNAADDAATASHDIVTNFSLNSGDYYLTVYGSSDGCPTTLSNFAWFISAWEGINLIDAQGAHTWRSATFPTPGFARYTLPAQYVQQPNADPNDLYNTAFDIFGAPTAAPSCPADFNNDGVRNGLDLTVMLSSWGTPAGDVNGDGTTNGLDLTVLLSGWGNCPG